jgi:hypothetical protein
MRKDAMPARPQCEYRDLAVSLQYLIRNRGVQETTDLPLAPNLQCTNPSDVLIDTDSGKKFYCSAHVHTRALALAEPVGT